MGKLTSPLLRMVALTMARRGGQALLVALVVGVLTFALVSALPGDAAFRIAAGRYGEDMVSAQAAAHVRTELGLERPAWLRLAEWLTDLAQGDLGRSMVSGEPVWHEIRAQLGHTLVLSGAALAFSLALGPPVGFLIGLVPGSMWDRGALLVSAGLRATPAFALGILLILVFSVALGLVPTAGHHGPSYLVLPALTLALLLAAVSSRVARDAIASVVRSPYFFFARTKGLSATRTLAHHGLRNAAVPVVAYVGVQLVHLIEGVVVVESLFAWPGIGHALVHAIFARDVPMVQGTALIMGLLFVLLNTVVDLACLAIDPRRLHRIAS